MFFNLARSEHKKKRYRRITRSSGTDRFGLFLFVVINTALLPPTLCARLCDFSDGLTTPYGYESLQ